MGKLMVEMLVVWMVDCGAAMKVDEMGARSAGEKVVKTDETMVVYLAVVMAIPMAWMSAEFSVVWKVDW